MKLFIFLKWFFRAKYFWVFNNKTELLQHQESQLEKYQKYLLDKGYQGRNLLKSLNESHLNKKIIQDNFEQFNAYGFKKD